MTIARRAVPLGAAAIGTARASNRWWRSARGRSATSDAGLSRDRVVAASAFDDSFNAAIRRGQGSAS